MTVHGVAVTKAFVLSTHCSLIGVLKFLNIIEKCTDNEDSKHSELIPSTLQFMFLSEHVKAYQSWFGCVALLHANFFDYETETVILVESV